MSEHEQYGRDDDPDGDPVAGDGVQEGLGHETWEDHRWDAFDQWRDEDSTKTRS